MSDVLIIGAGPAGCVAGVLLARAGVSVRLLEQHTFPRDKVCGECVSALGIDVLTRTGLSSRVSALHPACFTRALLHADRSPAIDVPLPRAMWGVSRASLDSTLLDAARDAGVIVTQPARCERIVPAHRPTVRWRCLRTNELREEQFDWVLLADGKGELLSESSPTATGDLGIKAHFTSVAGPRDAIELFGVAGHYGGVAAVEGDRWNVAFSVPVERVRRSGGDVENMFARIIRENAALRHRFAPATRVSPWLASPLPRFAVRPVWPEHVIPIGNAAAALEPVGGEGMGLAMRSAELAVSALTDAKTPIDELRRRFDQLWRTRSWGCRWMARLLSTPALAEAAAPLVEGNQQIVRAILSLTGKN
jgi:2-polyprenyl-6-methoxyphenol hydroxylase-like FAD-dependent oxidoreductase